LRRGLSDARPRYGAQRPRVAIDRIIESIAGRFGLPSEPMAQELARMAPRVSASVSARRASTWWRQAHRAASPSTTGLRFWIALDRARAQDLRARCFRDLKAAATL